MPCSHVLPQNLFVHCRFLLLLLLLLSSLPNSSSIMTLLHTTTNTDYGNDVQHKEENPVVDNVATVIPDSFTMGGGGVYPSDYEGHLQGKMISNEDVRDRIREIAKQIRYDYKGRRPVLLCTLKGACPFYQHLCDSLQDLRQGYYNEYVRVSSYEGTSSTGQVKITGLKDDGALRNRHVIIIEDIIDTGTTLSKLIPKLEEYEPKSIQVCSLLDKRLSSPDEKIAIVDAHQNSVVKYIGFSIPNKFIIGYGLDYNELYRDLKDIWVISQKGIEFGSSPSSS